MLQFEELRQKLWELEKEVDDLGDALGTDKMFARLEELEKLTAGEFFWQDASGSHKVLKEISDIKNKLEEYKKVRSALEDSLTLVELALEAGDESVYEEAKAGYTFATEEIERQRLSALLTGEYDRGNAIMTFHAGAGGTEAADWAQMLYRMYTRRAERHGCKYSVLDYQPAEEAGIKSATILIEGNCAYGFLKSEAGVHRLVRISPFDSSGRRHTSFASVEVMPEIGEDFGDIDIKDEDLKIDTYRAGGAGGQHVNKTESAVRMTHLPTGVVVACQNERSQHQNREVAMKMLKSKLAEIKEREHLEKIEDIKGDQKAVTWGSQIRSYVFMPYTLVKDHRTGAESGNISAVMDGDIEIFINSYLKAKSQGEL